MNKHEPFIEHCICVVKERVRSIQHSLPFQTIPKVILTHMVCYAVKLLNYFPVKGGVFEIYGPKAIMSGKVLFPSALTAKSMRRDSRATALLIGPSKQFHWGLAGMPRVCIIFLPLT
jgi:hypothetical protein